MVSLNFSPKGHDLESYLRCILDKTLAPESFLNILESKQNWIENNSNSLVSDKILNEFVCASYKKHELGVVLAEVMDAVGVASISDLVFDAIMRHPDENIRQLLLISLSHKSLRENQLRSLCDEQICFECFFELAILYYTRAEYPIDKFSTFVDEFAKSKYSYLLVELISELMDCYTASSDKKRNYLLKLKDSAATDIRG